ncbi:nitrate- and nitrite sensing domain-containing protein [Streptomyces sp. CA-111067]|uniref:sensor histidine kinase n=1 Tax=Streptomyces sp. CA-111067 TaxID=3240046 RepID=UPI003D97BF44
MLAALLVCSAAVLAASAPGVALAVRDLSHAQDRAGAAERATRAIVLAHALADERDDLAVAAARPHSATGLPAADRERVDRQVADVSAGAPADLRTALAGLPGVRKAALTGKGGPQAVITGYQPLIDALGRTGGPVGAPLSRAAGAAAVERGLLVSALTAGGGQRALVAAAQAARVQEQAALAEFRATADAGPRRQYDQTVIGPDAALAERDLAELLDQPQLTAADTALGTAKVDTALSARISLMRSVDASLATGEVRAAGSDRNHAVTVLELRSALTALCLLLLAGVLVTVFRSLTRPLAALHRWSKADAESGQGVEVIGADEYAAVARRANALTHEAQALRARTAELGAERTTTLGVQEALGTERDSLLRTRDDLTGRIAALERRLATANAQTAAQLTQVNLSLRTLGLVERQLALIETMEEHEQEPDRLETLFKLDHLATRMRRNSENLLVLTGTEHSHGATARPVPLVDVARAAISETERYERVRVQMLPASRVAGRAADDISHLMAELLDNAAAFSTPQSEIHVSGWLLESGEVMLSVEDSGIGMPQERLDEVNATLAAPAPPPPGSASGIGLYVAGRLAHRHGVRIQLRPQQSGGTAAVVVLPRHLLPELPPNEAPATPIEAAIAGAALPQETPGAPAAPAAGTAAPAHAAPAGASWGEASPSATGVPESPPAMGGANPVPAAAPVLGTAAPAHAAPAGASWAEASPSVTGVPEPGPAAQPAPGHARAAVAAEEPSTHEAAPDPSGTPAVPVRLPAAGMVAPARFAVPAAPPAPEAATPSSAAPAPAPEAATPSSPTPAPAPEAAPSSSAAPAPDAATPPISGLTGQGLPQRVPRGVAGETRGPERGVPVDAGALRERLGMMQRGLAAGRRDAEIEISSGTGPLAGATPARGTDIAAQSRPGQGAHRRPSPAGDGPAAENAAGPYAGRRPEPGNTQGDAEAADTVEEATR